MGDGSSIEWLRDETGRAGATWPFINGCRRVSEGCRNCYAERLTATRLRQQDKYKHLATMTPAGPRWTGAARLWAPHLGWPMRWTRPRRIFPVDMGDLFYEEVTDVEIAAGFGIMAACPQHTFIVLTKRLSRARAWFEWAERATRGRFVGPALAEHAACHYQRMGDQATADLLFSAANRAAGRPWPLPNVWMGASVEDQWTAQVRLPMLTQIPAVVRHVSVEPLLEEVDLTEWLPVLDWLIIGGESGPMARGLFVEWVRRILADAALHDVACFVKQLGGLVWTHGIIVPGTHWPPGTRLLDEGGYYRVQLRNKKGSDPTEWPPDLRIQELQPRRRKAA
jgi:protein gp37